EEVHGGAEDRGRGRGVTRPAASAPGRLLPLALPKVGGGRLARSVVSHGPILSRTKRLAKRTVLQNGTFCIRSGGPVVRPATTSERSPRARAAARRQTGVNHS